MKTLLVAVNSKFIHTALAVRLLYLAARPEHTVFFREFVTKEETGDIAGAILEENPDVVAFSCYIWNISKIEALCSLLKKQRPGLTILLGGPEVSYEAKHFLETLPIDYVLQGEGEETFPALLSCLEKNERPDIPGVSSRNHISSVTALCDLQKIEALGSPYNLPEDEANKAHRILYFESSRGCPFGCSYCLSSLEKGMRFFSRAYLEEQLSVICRSQARTVKFLDRSFCANTDHALFVLDYIFSHHAPHQQFQIEVNADCMPQKVIDFIKEKAPEGLLRLEVGIQSTFAPSNKAVGRIQNFEKLRKTVRDLDSCSKVDLHLDLIAGLPLESYSRFCQSFDDVYALGAKELQLGFLKLLRGTSLRTEAGNYGYVYDEKPPYELQKSNWMTEEDIRKIHLAEDMLEKFSNSGRFPTALPKIMSEYSSPFSFFLSLGEFYQKHGYPVIAYQQHELFECLDKFTEGRFRRNLIPDYYALFKRRPTRWWPPTIREREKKDLIRKLAKEHGLSEDLLFHHALLEDLGDCYLLVLYQNSELQMKYFEKT